MMAWGELEERGENKSFRIESQTRKSWWRSNSLHSFRTAKWQLKAAEKWSVKESRLLWCAFLWCAFLWKKGLQPKATRASFRESPESILFTSS